MNLVKQPPERQSVFDPVTAARLKVAALASRQRYLDRWAPSLLAVLEPPEAAADLEREIALTTDREREIAVPF